MNSTGMLLLLIKRESVEFLYKVRNGWDQSSLVIDYQSIKLLKKLLLTSKYKTKAWLFAIVF